MFMIMFDQNLSARKKMTRVKIRRAKICRARDASSLERMGHAGTSASCGEGVRLTRLIFQNLLLSQAFQAFKRFR